MAWNPYLGRMDQTYQYQTPVMNVIQGQVIRVSGRAGANALQMAPNSSVIVADDTNNNHLFLCMTDGAGFKTIRPMRCEFEDIEPEPQEDRLASFEKRLKELEGVVNDKLNPGNARKRIIDDSGSK